MGGRARAGGVRVVLSAVLLVLAGLKILPATFSSGSSLDMPYFAVAVIEGGLSLALLWDRTVRAASVACAGGFIGAGIGTILFRTPGQECACLGGGPSLSFGAALILQGVFAGFAVLVCLQAFRPGEEEPRTPSHVRLSGSNATRG